MAEGVGTPVNAAAPGPHGPDNPRRAPAWLTSLKVLVPAALLVAAGLLGAFASVVQQIVHQGEVGHPLAPAPAVSPGVDRV